jgi:hypothetical protein
MLPRATGGEPGRAEERAMGDFLVTVLAWAALGAWWERNPSTDPEFAWEWTEQDAVTTTFLRDLPEPLRGEIRAAHDGRVRPKSRPPSTFPNL